MARRRIGQEELIARPEPRATTSLAELATLLDWTEIDRYLVGISAAAKGEPGWPPLALFGAILLATWHDLSHVRLAEVLDDRASFRRFCSFAAHEPTPERTAFVRLRRELVRRGLDRVLFETVTHQLEAKDVMVRTPARGSEHDQRRPSAPPPPYAATIVPLPKAGDVARQNALAADIRERGDVDDSAAALAEHSAVPSHAQDLSRRRSVRKWRKFHLSLEMGGRGADISNMINAKSLFDSFLGQSGQAPGQGQVRAPAGFMEQAKSALGNISGGSFAGGAATGGILGMVLGGKGVQKIAGGVLGYGGAAALGALAHRAYQNWQQGQSPASAPVATQAETQNLDQRFLPAAIPAADGQPFELALIRAMVGAAKADGHLDATERNRIFERVETLGLDAEAKAFVFDALEQDIPVSTIAAAAQTPEQAAELYLAARMSIDPDQAVERAWLGALSHRLKLDPTLAAHLDRQADAGLQPAA